MIHPQTMKRMKTTALLTTLADRNARAQWEGKGALDTHARAMKRAREILSHASPAVFPAEVDSRIRANSRILCPGTCVCRRAGSPDGRPRRKGILDESVLCHGCARFGDLLEEIHQRRQVLRGGCPDPGRRHDRQGHRPDHCAGRRQVQGHAAGSGDHPARPRKKSTRWWPRSRTAATIRM